MNVIALDVPLLVVGIFTLLIARIFASVTYFQVLCQFFATFHAQFSLGLTWSLARIVPILAGLQFSGKTPPTLRAFLPFSIYVVLSTAVFSLFWEIPDSVEPFYGKYRACVQIFNFVMLCLTCRALAVALVNTGGAWLFWVALRVAVIIHGIASIYYVLAFRLGLPLIGMTRPHGQTLFSYRPDIAAFLSESGISVGRAGGLAGEPKTVAVLFGIVIFTTVFYSGMPQKFKGERLLTYAALNLSGVGFVLAYSTSCFLAFVAAVSFIVVVSRGGIAGRRLRRSFFLLAGCIFASAILSGTSFDQILGWISERTYGRMSESQVFDPPIEAALEIVMENPVVLFFGAGSGGSSFLIMEKIGFFPYAWAPNVGLVLLLVDSGAVGVSSFMGVFLYKGFVLGRSGELKRCPEAELLFMIGTAAFFFCILGSGIAMGLPVSVGCLAASELLVRKGRGQAPCAG